MMKTRNKTQLVVQIPPQDNLDIKIVFKQQRTIIPLLKGDAVYYNENLPEGHPVWIVALKFEQNTPSLALEEIILDGTEMTTLDFQTFSIPDLKRKLRVLDL